MAKPKYPRVKVKLSDSDGNAFSILGRVCAAMTWADIPTEEITAYRDEATSGDYAHLLKTTMEWVSVS